MQRLFQAGLRLAPEMALSDAILFYMNTAGPGDNCLWGSLDGRSSMSSHGTNGSRVESQARRKDTNAYVAAGLAGLGIIQAPSYAVQDALPSGKLTALLPDRRTPTIPVYVLHPPNRYLSAKVRVFIDWVVAIFARNERLRP